MDRRIIKQGQGGFTIYLPKAWVAGKGLKEGDPVQITETETALIVESRKVNRKKFSIDLTRENRSDLQNILSHLYRRGFDEIRVQHADDHAFSEIRRIARDLLLGFEASLEGKTAVLSNISEPSDEKYGMLLRRCFLIVKETIHLLNRAGEDGSFGRMKEVHDLKVMQDKFILFCRRIILKERSGSPAIAWELLTFLMHIEHTLYYTYQYCGKNKVKAGKDMIEMFAALDDYFDLYYSAYFKNDVRSIHRLNTMKKEFQFGRCYDLLEDARGKEAVVFSHLREAFRLIQIGASPILSGLLERTPSGD